MRGGGRRAAVVLLPSLVVERAAVVALWSGSAYDEVLGAVGSSEATADARGTGACVGAAFTAALAALTLGLSATGTWSPLISSPLADRTTIRVAAVSGGSEPERTWTIWL